MGLAVSERRLAYDPERGCGRCPLASHDDIAHESYCRAISDAGRRLPRLLSSALHRAPDWCPLRAGPVVVEAPKKNDG